jgi:hypothetical protein
MCLCVPFLWKSLHFLVRIFPFFFRFVCYLYFGTFLSMWNILINFLYALSSRDLSIFWLVIHFHSYLKGYNVLLNYYRFLMLGI